MTPQEKRIEAILAQVKIDIECMDAKKQNETIVWDTLMPQFETINAFHDYDEVYIFKIMRVKHMKSGQRK